MGIKRKYSILIEVDSSTKDGLMEAFLECVREVKSEHATASHGGEYEYSNYNARFVCDESMNEETWNEMRKLNGAEIAKNHFNIPYCNNCGTWLTELSNKKR